MRLWPALAVAFCMGGLARAEEAPFESWTATCADTKAGRDCRVVTEAPAAAGARAMRITVLRAPAKDASPHLLITLLEPSTPATRPRLALAVDGGPPLRLAFGADLASAPGATPGSLDLKLSDVAARRLLPFLRRGKALDVSVTGDGGEMVEAHAPLPGFGPATTWIDERQGRAGRPDAFVALVGGGSPAVLAGRLRDVARDAIPDSLRKTMVARECPVWDAIEPNPSFLADESFAADLGGGRTLWSVVCASGAYNVSFALFVEDPSKAANRFDPLMFASFVESLGWTGVDTLSNVAYDPEKRLLTAFEKGRSAGDCGVYGAWEWVGEAFRMLEYRAKEECDGTGQPQKFPIIFRGDQ